MNESEPKASTQHAQKINGGPEKPTAPAEIKPTGSSTRGHADGIGIIDGDEDRGWEEPMKRFLGEGLSEQPWSGLTYFAKGHGEEEKPK